MDGKQLSERLFELWTDRNWMGLKGYLHDDYVYTGPDGSTVSGPEDGLEEAWKSFADGFSNAEVTLKEIYQDGETVITEFHVKGTHDGEFSGIPATGNRFEIDFCNVMKVKDGKVYRERDYIDTLGFMQQLGVIES